MATERDTSGRVLAFGLGGLVLLSSVCLPEAAHGAERRGPAGVVRTPGDGLVAERGRVLILPSNPTADGPVGRAAPSLRLGTPLEPPSQGPVDTPLSGQRTFSQGTMVLDWGVGRQGFKMNLSPAESGLRYQGRVGPQGITLGVAQRF